MNRDLPFVGLPGMLCAMRVHCLLAFHCPGHYHAIVEGPRWDVASWQDLGCGAAFGQVMCAPFVLEIGDG